MTPRAAGLLALLVVLAGCATPGARDEPGGGEVAPPPPIGAEPPTFFSPIDLGGTGRASEPNIAVGPNGRVYVASAPQLWRSVDGGATFTKIGQPRCDGPLPTGGCIPGREFADAGLDGFSGDADLAVDAQGVLYFVGLYGESGTVPFMLSRDEGETWTEPYDLADGNESDRQWITALPNGTLYVTWRDRGEPGANDPPSYLLFRRSRDGGATWDPRVVIGEDRLQGPLAVDLRTGALYNPYYDGGLRVARSLDMGDTWTHHDVTNEPTDLSLDNDKPINIFPSIDVDAAGTVYLTWSEDVVSSAPGATKALAARVVLSRSTDGGEAWSEPLALSTEGHLAFFPWVVAGQPGRIALAWYESAHPSPAEDAPNAWNVRLVESVDAAAPAPTFLGGFANEEPIHLGTFCADGGGCQQVCPALDRCAPTRICAHFLCAGRDRSRLDFFEMAIGANGHPLLVWPSDADASTGDPALRLHVGGVASGTPLG